MFAVIINIQIIKVMTKGKSQKSQKTDDVFYEWSLSKEASVRMFKDTENK